MTSVDTTRVAAALTGYELGAELGRGGFGAVLAGRHRLIDRPVAVKVLLESVGGDSDLRARFLAEARVLAGLDHPHVVRMYDYVEQDGLCLLVMEQLTGGSLKNWRPERPDPRAVCAIGLAAAAALSAAHDLGVLHRDVKPDNLLFTGDGVPKVTDFGIAKILETTAATTTGLVGTPRYMAPEQITGNRLGPGTDLYSLGIVLYELLAGRTPFPRDLTVPALLHHHMSVAPLPLTEAAPPLASVVLSALAKDPGWRPPTARDFALALATAATSVFGPGWLAASGVPVRLPDDLLAAAGHTQGTTPTPAELAANLGPGFTARDARGHPSGGHPLGGPPLGGHPLGGHPLGGPPRGGPPPAGSRPGWSGGGVARTKVDHGGQPGSRGGHRAGGGGRRTVLVAAVAAVAVLAAGLGLGLWLSGRGGDGGDSPAWAGEAAAVTGLYGTAGLAIGPDGDLYVADPGSSAGQGQVFRLGADGKVTRIGGVGPPATTPTPTPSSPSPTPVLGDGGPAVNSNLISPSAVAAGPDGELYVADGGDGRIRRIDPDGTITTVAGAGPDGGFGGASGRAVDAKLSDPDAVEVADDGTLYIAAGYRIRKVTPDGAISVVAGSANESGTAGDGGPAINATLSSPSGLALTDDGTLYVADENAHTVRRITPDGKISLVAGIPGKSGYEGDGGPATDALLYYPADLAVGPLGELYIADAYNDVIRMVDSKGVITTFAGTADYSADDADGATASETRITSPTGVVVDTSGAVYVSEGSNGVVRRIGPDRIVRTVLREADE